MLSASVAITGAHATMYDGNGGSNGGGGVGSGEWSVTNDGSGGVDFSFTLGNSANFATLGGGVVMYVDNGTGGGIANTGVFTATNASFQREIGGYSDTGARSLLSFGGLFAPQYAIDFDGSYSVVVAKINTGATPSVVDGGSPGGSLDYIVSGDTASVDIPAADLGLSSVSGATLQMMAIYVSNEGQSSDEATVTLSGNSGYGQTQTVTSVNEFTEAAPVPEASTLWMLACGAAALVVFCLRRNDLKG